MNFKSLYLGLCLCSAFSVDINAMDFLKKDDDSSCLSKTSSTRSMSLKSVCYDEMSLSEKYAVNLRSFKQDRKTSLQRMEKLALTDNYEEAQIYLAACYSMGTFGKPDVDKAIKINTLALEKNESFRAALFLAQIFWSDGDYNKTKEYCTIAKKIALEKNLDSSAIERLLAQRKFEGF